ncbi:hypothetical protein B0H14DRAFT_3167566 [Mycena olivaceomarginata]|nr:hypothetical protein B0H14DRAFT_3167566 [Mycena olivaceomarginata]
MWSGITQIRYTDVEQPTVLAGSVILDNVKFTGISTANIQDSAGTVVAANAANVPQWFQGNRVLGSVVFISRMVVLTGTTGQDRQNVICAGHTRPNALIDGSRAFFSRSRPQYETYKDIQFFSIMAIGLGAGGDGVSDDTVAINTFLSKREEHSSAPYSGCAAIGAANEGVKRWSTRARHTSAPHEPPAFLPYGARTRAELCHVVRRISSPLCRSSALSYHGGRWGASPRVGDWARSTIIDPAGGVGGIARWGNRPRRGGAAARAAVKNGDVPIMAFMVVMRCDVESGRRWTRAKDIEHRDECRQDRANRDIMVAGAPRVLCICSVAICEPAACVFIVECIDDRRARGAGGIDELVSTTGKQAGDDGVNGWGARIPCSVERRCEMQPAEATRDGGVIGLGRRIQTQLALSAGRT